MAEEYAFGALRIRIRIFVDFWNFTLSMRDLDPRFRTDWGKFGPSLAAAAASTVDSSAVASFQGLNIYGSYGPNDSKLKRWADTILDTFPGVRASMMPRQRKQSGPPCPTCHMVISHCPKCNADMRGTEEKGVDVRLTTAMISLAWEDNYDVAVLVSSDRDFVPVAEFLDTKGKKVIHGAFPPKGNALSQACWGSVRIPEIQEQFRR